MDIDFSGIWSWTVPLWLLFILVLFLVGALRAPVILEGLMGSGTVAAATAAATDAVAAASTMSGGSRGAAKKRVRFAD